MVCTEPHPASAYAAVQTPAAGGAKLRHLVSMRGLFMIEWSAPGLPARHVLRDVLTSWLRAWSTQRPGSIDVPSTEIAGPNPHSSASVRVLVVDDNPSNLEVMHALLASKGMVPMLAADGAEAVALACEMRFDLILMDLQMPILDGLEATAAIRHFENSCSQPAVPVVAYSSTVLRPGVLAKHGLNGSLAKPCDDHDLEDCLVQWCPAYQNTPLAPCAPSDGRLWQNSNHHLESSSRSLR